MALDPYRSWGYEPVAKLRGYKPAWSEDVFLSGDDLQGDKSLGNSQGNSRGSSWLPFGNGRSYGDSCLNQTGTLIDSRALDRFIAFDQETGLLTAEPGVTLASILKLIVPLGWFLPVRPGTSFVTLGGAIANDVHGKNHHCDGTFGRHVSRFSLQRSSGEQLECSAQENVDLYRATIGGLGLTGMVTNATIQLIPISSAYMDVRIDTFQGLDEFQALSDRRAGDYRYTVAWLDCVAGKKEFARGVFFSANHADTPPIEGAFEVITPKLSVPCSFPAWFLNRYSVRAFNSTYYFLHRRKNGTTLSQHFKSYFYPLDALDRWNRIYGSKGFYQYQFVVPREAIEVLDTVLKQVVEAGLGSFLAVLKEFGDLESPGLLSFPRKGYCLALDFASRGDKTVKLINTIDSAVCDAGGAAYPAKDRLMSEASFKSYYPDWERFTEFVDPQFNSDFWQRVRG